MSARIQSVTLLVFLIAGTWLGAQEAPKQEFWVQRIKGGAAYVPPNKPHTKLSDVKAKYKGQPAWRETVVKDGESIADYVSMAPGTKVSPRLHPATPSLFVVFEGEMRWQIENQEVFTAKRGSERKPSPYVPPNKPHFNLHDSIKANPGRPGGVQVRTEHLYANANYGFADPNDPANPNRSAAARGAGPAPAPVASPRDFNPNVPAGHLHPGSSEWWIVLVGQISAKFESGSYIASEGDILYAPPYMSHAMANYGPGGSCRIAIGWYDQEHFDPPVE